MVFRRFDIILIGTLLAGSLVACDAANTLSIQLLVEVRVGICTTSTDCVNLPVPNAKVSVTRGSTVLVDGKTNAAGDVTLGVDNNSDVEPVVTVFSRIFQGGQAQATVDLGGAAVSVPIFGQLASGYGPYPGT